MRALMISRRTYTLEFGGRGEGIIGLWAAYPNAARPETRPTLSGETGRHRIGVGSLPPGRDFHSVPRAASQVAVWRRSPILRPPCHCTADVAVTCGDASLEKAQRNPDPDLHTPSDHEPVPGLAATPRPRAQQSALPPPTPTRATRWDMEYAQSPSAQSVGPQRSPVRASRSGSPRAWRLPVLPTSGLRANKCCVAGRLYE
jgi:hypothetical protein